MADGAVIAVPRATQTGDQNIESIEADRGGGIRLIQSVCQPCIPGTVVVTGQISVLTSSTTIRAANDNRVSLWIYNNGNQTVFIRQGTAVITDWPVPPGGWFQDSLTPGAWSGISNSGTQNVRFMEVGLP